MTQKMKNWPHRYNINRPSPRHGNKYTKYKMCLSIMIMISIMQHISSIQEKVKQH